MLDFISKLFRSDFMPHGHCFFWRPEILWLHVFSDVVIGAAYYSIPVALIILVRKREDLAFDWMFLCFAAFIFLCGTTHFMSVWTVWNGTYRIEGVVKLLTAIVSAATAIVLWPLIPKLVRFPSTHQLEKEIQQREFAEEALRRTNSQLEERIAKRTMELQESNDKLRETSAYLQNYRTHLEELVVVRTKELVESQAQLRQSERISSLGVLAAGLAHEINNPIGAIMVVAENSVATAAESNDSAMRTLLIETCNKILNHSKRCGTIVRGILQFSRRQSPEKHPCEVHQLLKNSIELTEATLQTQGIQIDCQFDPSNPVILAGQVEVEQVFVNIIRNALEAGGSGVGVTITTLREDFWVVVEIRDTGPGMSSEVRDHIFDPFFTTRQQKGGTGLGLSIAHGIIADHDGSIDVQSRLGEGTIVRLKFPVLAASETTHVENL